MPCLALNLLKNLESRTTATMTFSCTTFIRSQLRKLQLASYFTPFQRGIKPVLSLFSLASVVRVGTSRILKRKKHFHAISGTKLYPRAIYFMERNKLSYCYLTNHTLKWFISSCDSQWRFFRHFTQGFIQLIANISCYATKIFTFAFTSV